MTGPLVSSAQQRAAILVVTLGGALFLAGCGLIGVNAPAVVVPDGDPLVGRALLDDYACVTCHEIPGVRGPEASLGPPLTNWAQREYIAGKLANTPENLIAWIVNPQAIEPGTVMPTLGVTPEEARDIAAYLYAPQDGALADLEE